MKELLDQAVQLLRAGRLVAFATETVYGLGADARSAEAVERIFLAKGRPSTNPLIVHVSGVAMAKVYARVWSNDARVLGRAFWPGPLTLVVPRHKSICKTVSAGRDTVGLRVPNHPMALELIYRFDGPIAAPSANRSTHVSPTTAQHVRDELGSAVDLVLDGGACAVGIESTVLDLTGAQPRILRPGAVTREQIERVIGRAVSSEPVRTDVNVPASSPGQHDVHYAPVTPAFRFEGANKVGHLSDNLPDDLGSNRLQSSGFPRADVGVMELGQDAQVHRPSPTRVVMPDDPAEYARNLYAVLRELDAMKLREIHIEIPPDTVPWAAVRDRIVRATRPRTQ